MTNKKLVNLQQIDFENDFSEEVIMNVRFCNRSATDFSRDIFKNLFKFEDWKKVCEIGVGWGRNAPFWGNEEYGTGHIKYYGFDASPTSIISFKNNSIFKYSPEKQFVYNDLGKEILDQNFDFIFSTMVLSHIGFYENKENEHHKALGENIHDSVSICKELWNSLNIGGYFCISEVTFLNGQNNWCPLRWLNESFDTKKIEIIINEPYQLFSINGNPSNLPNRCILFRKIAA